ncbi:MAG TPA: vanadium-dependent haloperoxidase [Burkholderiaceae bacterium]
MVGLAAPGSANVITDWDARAVAIATPGNMGEREMALVHLAMFDAANSIDRRYRPYLVQLPAPDGTSQEAAAAAAAASVLLALHPDKAADIKAALAADLARVPDGGAKANGVGLGERIAAQVMDARAGDGAGAPDAYRPRTTPGIYVPTAISVGSAWPNMTPFALASASQFRPAPPVALSSKEWADDFNEIKSLGARNSTTRSAQQTETARFWLMIGPPAYHPIARQLVERKQLGVLDSARTMALYSVALTDAYIAVFDAKYHYEFWRPITAIRNGDLGGNPATERDAAWQPIDNTPNHPEYPCAHCIESGAAVAVLEALLGSEDIPEISLTSPTAPGITHRWSNLEALAQEVANARIWAGFHYRSSTRVGSAMGRAVGQYVVRNALQPASVAQSR